MGGFAFMRLFFLVENRMKVKVWKRSLDEAAFLGWLGFIGRMAFGTDASKVGYRGGLGLYSPKHRPESFPANLVEGRTGRKIQNDETEELVHASETRSPQASSTIPT